MSRDGRTGVVARDVYEAQTGGVPREVRTIRQVVVFFFVVWLLGVVVAIAAVAVNAD